MKKFRARQYLTVEHRWLDVTLPNAWGDRRYAMVLIGRASGKLLFGDYLQRTGGRLYWWNYLESRFSLTAVVAFPRRTYEP